MDKIKHLTASVLVFRKDQETWKVLLVLHKKFNKWMIPGGHVEETENPAEAAIREVKEETGLDISLHSFIHQPYQADDVKWVWPPEYIFEQLQPVKDDSQEHYHIDCIYLAITEKNDIERNQRESTDINWFDHGQVQDLQMFATTKSLALALLSKLNNNNFKL